LGKYLRRLAKELFGDEIAEKVWGRLEIIGDIAILRKSPEVSIEILRILGEELLNRLPYIKSVWATATPVEGVFRVRKYIYLAGDYRSTTIYKEGGCRFKVDIRSVYVSPVLSYEHSRIASLVQEGEFVINMFAGAGLFSIIMAKTGKPLRVISIDINPRAYELMVENIRLNGVEAYVEPVLGDASKVIRWFEGMADRVLMPLPKLAMKLLPDAIKALRGSGIIHVYDFVSAENKKEATQRAMLKYINALRGLGVRHELLFSRVVRSAGPRYYQVVLDIKAWRDAS